MSQHSILSNRTLQLQGGGNLNLRIVQRKGVCTTVNARVAPNEVSFNSLMAAWALKGNIRKVEALYHEMLCADLMPNVVTYGTLITL